MGYLATQLRAPPGTGGQLKMHVVLSLVVSGFWGDFC